MGSIRLCKQEDSNGCGIACVAMITNKSYEEVKESLVEQQKDKARKNITLATDLNLLLKKFGVTSEIKKSSSWDEISGVSIIGVDRPGIFHWIVAIKNSKYFFILDPSDGEVLNGKEKIKKKRYKHGSGRSNYISIDTKVNSIKM